MTCALIHPYTSIWLLSLESTRGSTSSFRVPRGGHSRGDGLVPLHVLLTVHCGPEALLTERALVGLHAHVRGHVPREAAVGRERGVADTAAERLDPCGNGNKSKSRISSP